MRDEFGRVFLGTTPANGREGTRRAGSRAGVGGSKEAGMTSSEAGLSVGEALKQGHQLRMGSQQLTQQLGGKGLRF